MQMWVMLGWDGGGNRYGPAVFDYPVTREEIKAVFDRLYPGEDIVFGVWRETVNTKDNQDDIEE